MNWNQLDRELVWHPFTPLIQKSSPIFLSSAKGIHLITDQGRKIIDGISSWWVNIHGHSHPAIAKAIYEQAITLEHVIFAGFTHAPAIQLAEKLTQVLPKNQKKFFFSDNGSTAVEVALKMAIQYWHNQGEKRNKFIALEGAYHGDTFGAMAVGDRGLFTEPFHRLLFDVDFVQWPDGTNDEEVIRQFSQYAQSSEVAGFIYEPLVQGASGMRTYSPILLDSLLSIAKNKNIVCIADEVFTGFGRTGKYFASEYLSHQPDIITLSKGLTGGTMAMGITTCTEYIQAVFQSESSSKTFYHGHSFTANPLACASALASFELLSTHECWNNIHLICQKQKAFYEKIKSHKAIKTSHLLGTILSIELKTMAKTSYGNTMRDTIYNYFLDRNILLRPLGNIFYFLPSYAFTETEIDEVHKAIHNFLETL